ncbi:MAG: tetratricopeptide repeat protein [Candidatus Riflebacteria bacterium]|nr:tetratricopeptide repeat protein [Candidatus Riflebacteria bacterium]
MFGKIKRFLITVDDLAEVLVVNILFSRKNWWKTTAVLAALLALWMVRGSAPAVTPEAQAQRGYEALMKGDTRVAISCLKKAVARRPTQATFHQRLGLAYLEAGRADKALESLQTAFRLSPSRTTLYYIGCAYLNSKLYDVAIGVFTQVKSRSTKDAPLPEPAAWYEPIAEARIGDCFIRRGEYQTALQKLCRAAVLYPNSSHVHFYLGIAAWEMGRPARGAEEFFKVIELDPREPAAYYNIACYHSITGNRDRALEWLEKALKVGFHHFRHMETDRDLDNIRDLPRYKALVRKYKKAARGR